jgi:hypothetical protein
MPGVITAPIPPMRCPSCGARTVPDLTIYSGDELMMFRLDCGQCGGPIRFLEARDLGLATLAMNATIPTLNR